jgi:Xaa-Pro aminopeptidase
VGHLSKLRSEFETRSLDGLVIGTPDEFLSEFPQAHNRRLRWATGFQGSAGSAIILKDAAALFVDGRYDAQAARDTYGKGIDIEGASRGEQEAWVKANVRAGSTIGIDARCVSHLEAERLADVLGPSVEVQYLGDNPVDRVWESRPCFNRAEAVNYPLAFAGEPAESKIERLCRHIKERELQGMFVADPEDVSWLLNMRTIHASNKSDVTSPHIVPAVLSRAYVDVSGIICWFIDDELIPPSVRATLGRFIVPTSPGEALAILKRAASSGPVGANLLRTPFHFSNVLKVAGNLKDDRTVAKWRWTKNPTEIETARRGHLIDNRAIIRFVAWLKANALREDISELDAVEKLHSLRMQDVDYLGMSAPYGSASGKNSALAHYMATSETNRILRQHPIYYMDSGGQYFGCSTDNTVCVAIGEAEERQKRAHTLVLKGFIALSTAVFPDGISSSAIDVLARQFLWADAKDFQHGTGHGVGSFLNVHEGPYIRKDSDHPMVSPMRAGFIVTNEPAYYEPGEFGIRIEAHLLTVPHERPGFLKFEMLSLLPIDPALVDFSLLNGDEQTWLADHHAGIEAAHGDALNPEEKLWLDGVCAEFNAQARLKA